MKFWMKSVLAVAGFGGLMLGISSWGIGSWLLAPSRARVFLEGGIFAKSEVEFQSDSGALLKGNWVPGVPGKGVVILMHGVRGNRGGLAKHAEFLNAAGYSVLLFDFQAHGESSGKQITNGYLESKDAIAAMRFAREKAPAEKVAILGVSLGGAAAILAGDDLRADAMILEMVYPDIERAVKNRMALIAGNWVRPFSPLLTWQMKQRVGVGMDWFSPERTVARVNCPKLIVAGSDDRHTTLADTKALFAATKEPKELWIVDGAAHQNLHAFAGKAYQRRVLEFLDKTIRMK
jgi:fermentation-respiration switch protein FrsA (DUF1100 family)